LPPRKKAAKKNPGTEEVMQDQNTKSEAVKSDATQSNSAKSDSTKSVSPAPQSAGTPGAPSFSDSKPGASSPSASKPNSGTTAQSHEHADHHDLHARTQKRAYLNFLDRQQNAHHGDEHSDWVRAEQQIREEREHNQAPNSQTPKSENEHQSQGVRKDDASKSAKA
jgi:hypothetical protein